MKRAARPLPTRVYPVMIDGRKTFVTIPYRDCQRCGGRGSLCTKRGLLRCPDCLGRGEYK